MEEEWFFPVRKIKILYRFQFIIITLHRQMYTAFGKLCPYKNT